MAQVKVYDKQGKQSIVDFVDAREYMASGNYTMDNPNPDAPVEAGDAAADQAVREQAAKASTVAPSEPKSSRKK